LLILQVAPEIGTATGVGGVAGNLEREWQARGIPTARFTMTEAAGGWIPTPGPGVRGHLALLVRVVWFSTVGTVLARRAIRRLPPEAIVVCHNDALVGDVYINHGVLLQAMRNRGKTALRIVRNPLHPFTILRDAVRYRSRSVHRAVVSLTTDDESALRASFGRLGPRSVVIGNGVDIQRWRPPTDEERERSRRELGLPEEAQVVLFVGHEYGRKGLPELVAAVAQLPDAYLVVVGGTSDLIAAQRRSSAARDLGDRLRFTGALQDPRVAFAAADVLALPSAYESYGLVVLEALACGVPVVGTRTGCLPDVITEGRNGALVERTPASIVAGLTRVFESNRRATREAARASALEHSWARVAEDYLDLLHTLDRSRRL